MRLGIGTWAYPWSIGIPGHPQPKAPLDARALLREAHAFGLSLVQICDNLPYYEMSPAELVEVRQLAGELGITLSLGTRGVAPDHLLQVLGYARLLQAETLRTVIDMPDPGRVAEGLKQILSQLAEADVTLVLENTEILRVDQLAEIVRSVDSPYVRVCLDTANSLGALQPLEEVVAALAPYARMVHYKDFGVQRVQQAPPVFRMGFEIGGRPAGEGRVDFDWLMDAVTAYGADPDVVLEQWPPFVETIDRTVENEVDWVERSVTFLKARMAERAHG